MQITYPDYYKEFSCIAAACPDTCCAGWGIVIDEKSRKKYGKVSGAFGKRLRKSIDQKEHSFCQQQGRCAFLNAGNLCDIYAELGADYLCDTCRKYPRHIEEFENLREISLSLSCPEAARIILSRRKPTVFLSKERKSREETYPEFDFFLFDKLMDARNYLIHLLQNRELPIAYRMGTALVFAHDFQRRLRQGMVCETDDLIEKYESARAKTILKGKFEAFRGREKERMQLRSEFMERLQRLEVLNTEFPRWVARYQEILYGKGEAFYQEINYAFLEYSRKDDYQWEQLLVYFVFTYFCGAVYDEAAYAKVKMALVSVLLLREWSMARWLEHGRHLALADTVNISYLFSRELEHSDLNLNTMEEMMKRDRLFSMDNLLTAIDWE